MLRQPLLRTLLLPIALAGAVAAPVACGSSSDPADDGSKAPPAPDPQDGGKLLGADGSASDGDKPTGGIKTVFLILMENHSWATIKGSASANYINKTLVPMGAHAEQYSTPPGLHPSEPNYVWLEAGDNLGITDDGPPSANHQSTKDHLSTQLDAKGVTWKSYAEDITAGTCPLTASGSYDPKHTPQLYFDDVTGTNDPASAYCKDHVRPLSELTTDLTANKAARYNFITPNLCNDMHGELSLTCNAITSDVIKKGDDFLSAMIPKILASTAYKDNGVIFILWDEGDEAGFPPKSTDGPVPLLVISPLAKPGYSSPTKFTHSSMLRTIETIFGVPLLRGAQGSNDLSEMFAAFP